MQPRHSGATSGTARRATERRPELPLRVDERTVQERAQQRQIEFGQPATPMGPLVAAVAEHDGTDGDEVGLKVCTPS